MDLSRLIPRFELRPISPQDIVELYVERRTPEGVLEEQIENDFRQRRHSRVLLVGGRGCGKTSLNNYLFSHLMDKSEIVTVIASKTHPPRTVHEIIVDILNGIRELFENGRLVYAGEREIWELLGESNKTRVLLDNIRVALQNTSGLNRLLIIVDELDKGHPNNASKILLGLEDCVSRIGQNVDLLATIAPVTLKRYLDTSLRASFHEVDIPPLDRQRIIDVIEKRVNPTSKSLSARVPYSDMVDEDALDLIDELSLGVMRRTIDFISKSLQVAVQRKASRITKALVEEALARDARSAQYFYSTASRNEKEVIEAIRGKDWAWAAEKHRTLNDLIDRAGYVIETLDESRPFVVSPELTRALESAGRAPRQAIAAEDVARIRSISDFLYLGQNSEDGRPFTLIMANLTRGISIFGGPGSGKTVLTKAIIEEVALRGTPVIVFDTKGDLTELAFPARDLDRDKLLHYGLTERDVHNFGEQVRVRVFTPRSDSANRLILSPLVVLPGKGRSGDEDHETMCEGLLGLVDIDPRTKSKARVLLQVLLQHLSQSRTTASVSQIVELLENPPARVRGISSKKTFTIDEIVSQNTREKTLQGFNALLAGTDRCLFENGPQSFDLSDLMNSGGNGSRIAVVRLAHLSVRQQYLVLASLFQAFAFMMRTLGGNEMKPRLLLCLDEVWDLLREAPAVTKGIERLVRLGRAFGLGCLMASHLQRDIPRSLLALISTSFKATSQQGRFEVVKGSKRMRFDTRWLLTRHGVGVTEGELRSLKETRPA